MTQNPYAQFGQPGGGGIGGEFLEPLQSRTSVLAILALIAGLLCFVPGAGILALILGGAAVLLIGQSGGRLRGMGLAITGVVLGLLFSILWVMAAMGAVSVGQFFTQQFLGPVGVAVSGLESGDRTKARAVFTAQADALISDAQLDEFAGKLGAEWGAYQGTPAGLWDIIGDYMHVGQRMQAMQGRNDVFPAPVRFSKGVTIVMLQFDPTARPNRQPGPTGSVEIAVVNIGFIAKDGAIVWLMPPEHSINLRSGRIKVPPGTGGAPSEGVPAAADEDPDADAPEERVDPEPGAPPKGPKPRGGAPR